MSFEPKSFLSFHPQELKSQQQLDCVIIFHTEFFNLNFDSRLFIENPKERRTQILHEFQS